MVFGCLCDVFAGGTVRGVSFWFESCDGRSVETDLIGDRGEDF